jgi:hypothetical protein
MKITESQLRQTIRKALLEAINHRGEEMHPLTENDLMYWGSYFNSVGNDHPAMNCVWEIEDDVQGIWCISEGQSLKVFVSEGKLFLQSSEGYFGSTVPLGNPANLQDKSNVGAFRELFDRWQDMIQGNSRGAW